MNKISDLIWNNIVALGMLFTGDCFFMQGLYYMLCRIKFNLADHKLYLCMLLAIVGMHLMQTVIHKFRLKKEPEE